MLENLHTTSASTRGVILTTMVKAAITMMVTYGCCHSSIFSFWDNLTCIPILLVLFMKLVLSISSEMMMQVKNKVRRRKFGKAVGNSYGLYFMFAYLDINLWVSTNCYALIQAIGEWYHIALKLLYCLLSAIEY